MTTEQHDRWEERAAIMEYDGRLPRRQAERMATCDVLGLPFGFGDD